MNNLVKKILSLLVFPCCLLSTVRAEVIVNGVEENVKKNILLVLSLNQESCEAPSWKVKRLFEQADSEIDSSLRALGYYNVKLNKVLSMKKDCWQAQFEVQLGQQTTIKTIAITITGEAKEDEAFLSLTKNLQEKVGSPLQHSFYESIKTRFIALAQERGYLHAQWQEKKLLVNKQANQATIQLTLDSGIRQKFGEVAIEQTILDPEIANKYSSIVPGAFYGSDKLVQTYDMLSKSGYFEQIEIRPDFDRARGRSVPIAIHLVPKDTHHYSLGLGYGTDVGLLFNAAYQNRHLNREGDSLTANLDISFVLSTLEAEYIMPLSDDGDDPLNDFFTVGVGLKNENTNNFVSKNATVSSRLKYGFKNGWKQALFADFSYESFTTQQQSRDSMMFIFGGNWNYSTADNMSHPTNGYRLRFDLSGSYKTPISDASFIRANMDAMWIKTLPWGDVFTGHLGLGGMTIDQFGKLPTTYRFYAGGINSVRGYDYKELGPRDAFGNVEGGKLLSVVSLEYEHTVYDEWAIAGFVDSGNAYNLDTISVKTGIGLGVRWYSAIGPLRLDFALPLNQANSGFQIYFAAGARL